MGNIAKIVRIHCVWAEPPAPMVAVRVPPLTADGFLGNLKSKATCSRTHTLAGVRNQSTRQVAVLGQSCEAICFFHQLNGNSLKKNVPAAATSDRPNKKAARSDWDNNSEVLLPARSVGHQSVFIIDNIRKLLRHSTR